MTSGLAWLDTSADEQRRIRELVAMFSQRESRDELGIGQIRDVFSDLLFPGTSVLLTRARYFLLVPWAFRRAAQRGHSGAALQAHAANTERRLVECLREAGAVDGLIGARAGKNVKILPSAIYWSGLRTYRILTADKAPDSLRALVTRRRRDADEPAVRQVDDWDVTLPAPPAGFPDVLSNGLDLEPQEASWLRERILASVPDTMLTHLLTRRQPPDTDSRTPWRDSSAASAEPHLRQVLLHAELFSLVMQGAALLYNVQIGERYEGAGLTRVEEPVEVHREGYEAWLADVTERQSALWSWNRDDFWTLVKAHNTRITPATRGFVGTWTDAVLSGKAAAGIDDARLRRLVADRERAIKGGQSRLTNDKLLVTWAGQSGSGRLTYRWPMVRRIVADIQHAVGHDVGS